MFLTQHSAPSPLPHTSWQSTHELLRSSDCLLTLLLILSAAAPRALQVCEQKPLYLALLGILERSGRSKLAGDVWRTATKRFNISCKVRPRGLGLLLVA
jgi:hypothetical protein